MGLPQAPSSMQATGKATALKTGENADVDIWSSLLDSVAGGKRLPEKHVILLGSSPSTQRDFMDILADDNRKPQQKGQKSKVPVANEFALGYTYQDVLDADQEDVLARLSIHTLPYSSPSFGTLLSSLLNPSTVSETLAVLLLDWAEPWNWADQLCGWIQILKENLESLDHETKDAMDTVMQDWEQKRRGGAYDMGMGGAASSESNVSVPLGEGEWGEPIGIPLCVVCHNSEKIDVLEREFNWREEEFDYLLQFLRTVLLKHGASLVYTSNTVPNSVPLLVQASLGIHSSLSRQHFKHNVVDRDKILIPPNWDSWGKICVLREGFDVEGVSNGWSERIQMTEGDDQTAPNGLPASIAAFGETIKNPKGSKSRSADQKVNGSLEVETPAMQEFLARQLAVMEQLKAEEEVQKLRDAKETGAGADAVALSGEDGRMHVDEQIGPVQFNMGGIQVDAEDVLRRIKENARDHSPEKKPAATQTSAQAVVTPASKIDSTETQQLSNFFSSLIKRGTSTSPSTPQGKES